MDFCDSGFWVLGMGHRNLGFGFWVLGLGFTWRVGSLHPLVQGSLGFRVLGFGFTWRVGSLHPLVQGSNRRDRQGASEPALGVQGSGF